MKLPQCSASPARSTPGPLPYHMPNTPSTRLPGKASSCCVPYSMVAARSSLTPGWKRMFVRRQQLLPAPELAVQPAQRRAAIAGDEAAGVQPGGAVEPRLFQQDAQQRLDAGQQDRACRGR